MAYGKKPFFDFKGFEPRASHDTDPNLGALKIVLGAGRFVLYLAFVMAFSLLTGLAVNLI